MHTRLDEKKRVHLCELLHTSDSCLPRLPPTAGRGRRLLRSFRKTLILWDGHYGAHAFRSASARKIEKKRCARLKHRLIVHPFSKISFVREVTVFFIWLFVFFKDPFVIAFSSYSDEAMLSPLRLSMLAIDGYLFLESCLCFCTGYQIMETNEVVINPKMCMLHYLRTYFLVDTISTIPFDYIILFAVEKEDQAFRVLASCTRLLRLFRLKTVFTNTRDFAAILNISEKSEVLFCMILLTFYLMHWSACLLYFVPNIKHRFKDKWDPNSWTAPAFKRYEAIEYVSHYYKYIVSFHIASTHFYQAGNSLQEITLEEEQWAAILILLVGISYACVIQAVLMEMMCVTNISESKYEQHILQVKEYANRKNLSKELKYKMLVYYERLFRRNFFNEEQIHSTLSTNLNEEIIMYDFRNLIQNIIHFKRMSRDMLIPILSTLSNEFFLENDVIQEVNTPTEYLYIILYGTVSVYGKNGNEIIHLIDGDMFGELGLLSADKLCVTTVIAVETTHLLKMAKSNFDIFYKTIPEFTKMIDSLAENKYIITKGMLRESLSQRREIKQYLDLKEVIEKFAKRNYIIQY